jgi:hypothetical protein
MIDQLKTQYEQVCTTVGLSAQAADMTVVFGAAQNSEANFVLLTGTGLLLHRVGALVRTART